MTDSSSAVPGDPWLAATLPFVRAHLPPSPAYVLEVGCGPLGGFVPALSAAGYDVVGVDPEAPEGPKFRRIGIEEYDGEQLVDVVVASLSLHHVADPGVVIDRFTQMLKPDGAVVVVEWASERFDEATARWCFARLATDPPPDSHAHTHAHADADSHADTHDESGWLHHRASEWKGSGLSWDAYQRAWTDEAGLNRGDEVVAALQRRFETLVLREGPYFFPDLDASREDEQAAIDAGQIQPSCLSYVGRLR